MTRLARVFISSVFGGRMEDRRRIADAARLMGFEVSLTETLIAANSAVHEVLEREIAGCDTYVGLFGERRGTLLEEAGIPEKEWSSITEWELARAGELGLPRLVLYDGKGPPPPEVQKVISSFGSGVYAVMFDGDRSLRHAVTSALAWRRPRVVLNLWRGPESSVDEATPNVEPQTWAQLRLGWMRPALERADPESTPVDLQLDPEAAALFDRFLGADQPGRVLNEAGLKVLGAKLIGLLPAEMQDALTSALKLSKQRQGFVLPLVIRTDLPEALALPWELLHLDSCPLAVRHGQLEIVRQVHSSGPGDNPLADALPRRETAEFSLLGFVADPVEDQQSGVRFGAEGGVSEAHNLFVEKEQEQLYQALEPILGRGPNGEPPRGRVVLTDTGDVAELIEALGRSDRPGILHLGCHGGPVSEQNPDAGEGGRAALFLEDQDGHRHPVFAEDLGAWTNRTGRAIELAVLSACFTSSSWAVEALRQGLRSPIPKNRLTALRTTGSLTEGLIAHGILRVLGMQTSVSDLGASRFARTFYSALAEGRDLTQALSAGRSALAEASDRPHEWAIPALWVTHDFQPLAAPAADQETANVGVERPQTPFEVAGVAYLREGYVERREFTRRARLAWREARLIAIHGIGGIGKSTYAARLLQRREQVGWRVLILTPGSIVPAMLLDSVAQELDVQRPGGVDPKQAEATFERDLAAKLAEQPTAVLLDNFEDNTDESGAVCNDLSREIARLARLLERVTPQDRVNRSHGATLTGGRIVLTTRYAPKWAPGIQLSFRSLSLGELSRAESRKLKLERPGLRLLVRPCDGAQGQAALDLDRRRWDKVLEVFGGHPKALTLLADHIAAEPDAPLTLIDDIDRALAAVQAKLENPEQRHEHGRQLLIDRLVAGVPPEHLPTLQRLALALDPMPREDAARLLVEAKVNDAPTSIHWLQQRGLLALSLSSQTGKAGLLVQRLVVSALRRVMSRTASRSTSPTAQILHTLPTEDLVAFHTALAAYYRKREGPLQDLGLAAHHHAQAGDRPAAFQAVTDWAAALSNRHAYRAAIETAERGMATLGEPATSSELVSWGMGQIKVFDCHRALGEVAAADATLESVSRIMTVADSPRFGFFAGSLALRTAWVAARSGNDAVAMQELEKAAEYFASAGRERDRAIALSELARFKRRGGDLESAMALLEEKLSIVRQFGDSRDFAVTLGDIAHVKLAIGDMEAAMRLNRKRLQIARSCRYPDEIAAAQLDLAQCALAAQNPQEAIARLRESFAIVLQLGLADGIGIVGKLLGSILQLAGDPAARDVLQHAREAAVALGRQQDIAELDEQIAKCPPTDGAGD